MPPEYSQRFAMEAATNSARRVRDALEEMCSSLVLFGTSSKPGRY